MLLLRTTIKIFFVSVIVVTNSCKPVNKNNSYKNFFGLKLTTGIPILDGKGDPFLYEGVITRIRKDNMILYEFPETKSQSEAHLNNDGDIVSDSLLSLAITSSYFVYEDGATTGLFYRHGSDSVPEKRSVDSLHSIYSILNANKFLVLMIEGDSLIATGWNADKTVLTEQYLTAVKKDLSYNDSTIISYSKSLKGVDFSLSPKMDSLKGMKLSEIRMIYNPIPDTTDIYLSARRIMYFKMEKTPVRYEAEVREVFEQFDKDKKAFGL